MQETDHGVNISRRGEFGFAKPQFRALVRDGRISFAARGFFQFLWDLPHGWRPRVSHLVKMSGGSGKDALTRLRRELESVGGLAVEPIRLGYDEAVEKNATHSDRPRPYRAGQVVGTKWVLFSPQLWAIEMPLDRHSRSPENQPQSQAFRDPENLNLGLAGSRNFRKPDIPPLRLTNREGSPKEDSPTSTSDTTPTHMAASDVVVLKKEDENDMHAALVIMGKKRKKNDPAAWAESAIRRMRREALSREEIAIFENHRSEIVSAGRKEIASAADTKRAIAEVAAMAYQARAALDAIVSAGREKRRELVEYAIKNHPVSSMKEVLKKNREQFVETGNEEDVSRSAYKILLLSAIKLLESQPN